MPPSFWHNTIWFLLLGALTVLEIIAFIRKSKDWKYALAFYFTLCGIAFSFEAAICCFLKSYSYRPMIFPQSPNDDSLVGNLFSQYSVCATSLLLAVLKAKKYWIPILAIVYGAIEQLFLWLGVYTHNWYQTWITVVGLTVLFWATGKIYHATQLRLGRKLRCFFIFIGLFAIHMPAIIWGSKIAGILYPNMHVLPDELSSYAITTLTLLFSISITSMVVYFVHLKLLWKALLAAAQYGIILLLCAFRLISVRKGWFFAFSTVDIFGMYLCIFLLDRLYGEHGEAGDSIEPKPNRTWTPR